MSERVTKSAEHPARQKELARDLTREPELIEPNMKGTLGG